MEELRIHIRSAPVAAVNSTQGIGHSRITSHHRLLFVFLGKQTSPKDFLEPTSLCLLHPCLCFRGCSHSHDALSNHHPHGQSRACWLFAVVPSSSSSSSLWGLGFAAGLGPSAGCEQGRAGTAINESPGQNGLALVCSLFVCLFTHLGGLGSL